MKTKKGAALAAMLCAIAPQSSSAAKPTTPSVIPATPVGVMSAFPTIVQTGMKPTLTWSILYPSMVSDIAVINPPGSIVVTENSYVTVQIVGSEVTDCSAGSGTTPVYTDARVSYNGGTYEQLFFGTGEDVPPAKKLYVKKLAANDMIDFGGRYVKNGSWTPFFTSKSSNFQVISLVNGDLPPTAFPLYSSPQLANHMKPYLDGTGRVNIGPLSVLVMMELASTNHSDPCFDYQDQVLLLTFSKKHPNNGHGNNLDGVDVSNPGQGGGGPNGEIDPSGGIDDEIR